MKIKREKNERREQLKYFSDLTNFDVWRYNIIDLLVKGKLLGLNY